MVFKINRRSDNQLHTISKFWIFYQTRILRYTTFYLYNVQRQSERGTFTDINFDLWLELTNFKGTQNFKIWNFIIRIESIGDIEPDK